MPDTEFMNTEDQRAASNRSRHASQPVGEDSPDQLAGEFLRFHFGDRMQSLARAPEPAPRRFQFSNLFRH